MMGFTLSRYLDLQSGSLPAAWHINAPHCSEVQWESLG